MNIKTVLTVSMLGACLLGCGTAAPEPQQLQRIHSVFVKPVTEPYVRVVRGTTEWSPPGEGTALDRILTQHGLHLGAETRDALVAGLTQDGYQAAPDPGAADAIATVEIEFPDYVAGMPIFGGACTPIAGFNVRLTDARTAAVIFSRTYRFQSGGSTGITGDVLLDAGSTYNVDDCADLWKNPQVPIDAFHTAATDLAHAVAADLRKP